MQYFFRADVNHQSECETVINFNVEEQRHYLTIKIQL